MRAPLIVLMGLTLVGGTAACSTADTDAARPRGRSEYDSNQFIPSTLPDSAAASDSLTRAITPDPYRAALSLLTSPEE